MLRGLGIRDIVLIERLDLSLHHGLCVLTGETGAGKSILLDSLGLALGRRADAGLVRHGAAQGSVTAEFEVPASHPALALLAEQGLEPGDSLILRRVVAADGKSRAFINDQAVGVALLRRIGDTLVEIHGQNDEQGLLDAGMHRAMLDAFGGLEPSVVTVRAAHGAMRDTAAELAAARDRLAKARADEEWLRHVADELKSLRPEPGEESKLAEQRSMLQHGEKIATALVDAESALAEHGGVESRLRVAARALERVAERAGGRLDNAIAALDRAQDGVAEAVQALEAATRALDVNPNALEQAEERLFALRAAARKHSVPVDDLAKLREDFEARLSAIDLGSAGLKQLEKSAGEAADAYGKAAKDLTAQRHKAAAKLDRAVAGELKPLRMGAATFTTQIQTAEPSAEGSDRVAFLVSTNPGAPPGALSKIASGGELSRFMLALKAALAARGDAVTLVFDEVDRGVGGATADAVGERLARLADKVQVLVVTHSPQVAARGAAHWRIAKATRGSGKNATTLTEVAPLDAAERQEEIARMLAGASVTEAARAAAASLMQGRA